MERVYHPTEYIIEMEKEYSETRYSNDVEMEYDRPMPLQSNSAVKKLGISIDFETARVGEKYILIWMSNGESKATSHSILINNVIKNYKTYGEYVDIEFTFTDSRYSKIEHGITYCMPNYEPKREYILRWNVPISKECYLPQTEYYYFDSMFLVKPYGDLIVDSEMLRKTISASGTRFTIDKTLASRGPEEAFARRRQLLVIR